MMNTRDLAFAQYWAYARDILGAKWAPAILITLQDGPRHYKDILRDVRAHHSWNHPSGRREFLHEGILTRSLKALTESGMLVRDERTGVFPPSVTYALTPAAKALIAAAQPMATWAREHQQGATDAACQAVGF